MRGSAATVVLLVCLSVAVAAAPPTGLVGVWRFQSEVDTRADGSAVRIGPADGWEGYIVYTSDGFVSVNIMPKGRKWKLKTATLAELRKTIKDGSAYAGRYEADAAGGTVTYLLRTSLDPHDEGRRLIRRFTIEGEVLALSGTSTSGDETVAFTIHWVRER
jgi:hypothetical protein